MAKRKRLTPAQPGAFDEAAPETKPFPRTAPIAQVAGEAATASALQELSDLVRTARAEGRLIQPLPLDRIDTGHLVRDRLLAPEDEEMNSLIESLRARGQQTPIDVVALPDGRYGLISGLRRMTALTRLFETTGESRFSLIQARIVTHESAPAAYVAMVEENEIRAGLSLYERARIVTKAVEAGVFRDVRDALLTLYAAASRAKRSKIKSLLPVVAALDGALRFPTALSERAGLELAKALEADTGLGAKLRARLTEQPAASAEAEQAVLSAALRAPVVPVREVPKTLSAGIPSPPAASPTAVAPPTSDQPERSPPSSSAPYKPIDAFEPVPGVYIQSHNNGTRLIFTGPEVSDGLRHRISAWLRAQKSSE